MDAKEMFYYYQDTLKEAGYSPWFPPDNNAPFEIFFRTDEKSFFIKKIDPKNLKHFCMFSGEKYHLQNDNDRFRVLEAIS
jgi:hypothetical protein